MRMASAGDEEEQLCRCFKDFVKLSSAGKALSAEDEKLMNSKACGKMVKDCLPKQVQTIADASVFPKYKEKGKNHMHMSKFQPFIRSCAHEYAKIMTKNTKLPETDEKVDKYDKEFRNKLLAGGPDVKQVKGSKTGNVEGLTDASKYTGAHKERFDESGKGKGVEGRVDRTENTGYVGEYKGKDTFDEKH